MNYGLLCHKVAHEIHIFNPNSSPCLHNVLQPHDTCSTDGIDLKAELVTWQYGFKIVSMELYATLIIRGLCKLSV